MEKFNRTSALEFIRANPRVAPLNFFSKESIAAMDDEKLEELVRLIKSFIRDFPN
jgi:hypothetical protein